MRAIIVAAIIALGIGFTGASSSAAPLNPLNATPIGSAASATSPVSKAACRVERWCEHGRCWRHRHCW
jgi:hypothetical protein